MKTVLRTPGTVLLCAAALGAVGCANSMAERDAEGVTSRFLEAVATGDAAAACGLLTPRVRDEVAVSEGSPCEESLPAERLAEELAGRGGDQRGRVVGLGEGEHRSGGVVPDRVRLRMADLRGRLHAARR